MRAESTGGASSGFRSAAPVGSPARTRWGDHHPQNESHTPTESVLLNNDSTVAVDKPRIREFAQTEYPPIAAVAAGFCGDAAMVRLTSKA